MPSKLDVFRTGDVVVYQASKYSSPRFAIFMGKKTREEYVYSSGKTRKVHTAVLATTWSTDDDKKVADQNFGPKTLWTLTTAASREVQGFWDDSIDAKEAAVRRRNERTKIQNEQRKEKLHNVLLRFEEAKRAAIRGDVPVNAEQAIWRAVILATAAEREDLARGSNTIAGIRYDHMVAAVEMETHGEIVTLGARYSNNLPWLKNDLNVDASLIAA